MVIKKEENGNITSYATVGDIVGGIEVPETAIPEGFETDFWPGKWKHNEKTGKITRTGTEKPQPPEPEPDPRDVQLAEMAQRLEEQDTALMELAGMIVGGDM